MWSLGLVTLAIVAATTTALATPPSISIRGEACDLSALDAELAGMLSDKPVGDARVSVTTRGGDQALSADVLFVDAEGQSHGPRIVTASTCEDLFDSIALVVAMAIPEAAVRHAAEPPPSLQAETAMPPVEPSTAHTPEPAAASIATDSLAIARNARAEARTELSIDGYIGGASRITSRGLNEQVLLGARARRGRASLSLQARFDAPEEVQLAAGGKVTVTHIDVSFAPCAHVKALAGCAMLSVGMLHGSGEALYSARDAFTPVLATGLRIGWEHFVTSRLAVRVHVDGRASLTTTTFQVDYMPVWESSRIEGSAGVGLLARFL